MYKRELESYEEIEKQIDKTIVKTIENSDENLMQTLNTIPTSRNKRIL